MKTEFIVPNGAMYVFPKILAKNYSDDISLVYDLLQNGVAIAPGSGFGNSYKQFIRISACQSPKLLNEGLDILEKYLK
jgi:aspartate aminotransferase